jgi:hypothetical protein
LDTTPLWTTLVTVWAGTTTDRSRARTTFSAASETKFLTVIVLAAAVAFLTRVLIETSADALLTLEGVM